MLIIIVYTIVDLMRLHFEHTFVFGSYTNKIKYIRIYKQIDCIMNL